METKFCSIENTLDLHGGIFNCNKTMVVLNTGREETIKIWGLELEGKIKRVFWLIHN